MYDKSLLPEVEIVKRAYPFAEINGVYHRQWNYYPLIEAMGYVMLRVDDIDSSGDCRVLLEDEERGCFGILFFGFGSCSGCDALHGCASYEDLAHLYRVLYDSITWGTARELLNTVLHRDWATHPLMHGPQKRRTQHFLLEVTKVLEKQL